MSQFDLIVVCGPGQSIRELIRTLLKAMLSGGYENQYKVTDQETNCVTFRFVGRVHEGFVFAPAFLLLHDSLLELGYVQGRTESGVRQFTKG